MCHASASEVFTAQKEDDSEHIQSFLESTHLVSLGWVYEKKKKRETEVVVVSRLIEEGGKFELQLPSHPRAAGK